MFGFHKKETRPRRTGPWLKVITASETGLVRKDNQDSILADHSAYLYCVADGMGGGAEGARASKLVCDRMRRAVGEVGDGFVSRMEAVALSLTDANSTILGYAMSRGYKQMGSTAAVLLFEGEESSRAAVCHVGDSRVYRIRRGLASSLTRDHTVGVELGSLAGAVKAGEFSSRSNPLAHILTRAIGTEPAVVPEWKKIDVEPGDRFVICSDGVHDVVSESRLGFLAGYGPIEKVRERLSAEIVKNGAPDNYSFVLVEVEKGR
ncbi:MAG: serine/threonine-protein phosphatase [Kiritimatiellae bacterium]|nr:serine/threonine-protein phosphatase [Kiritimatiellia bacterium]